MDEYFFLMIFLQDDTHFVIGSENNLAIIGKSLIFVHIFLKKEIIILFLYARKNHHS